MDSGFSKSEMLRLAKIYRNFNPDSTPSATLPTVGTNIGGASVLLLVKSEASTVINAWEGISPPQQGTTATDRGGPGGHGSRRRASRSSVLNGSGRSGEAGRATTDLRAIGFNASIGGNGSADNFNYATPVIRYGPGGQAAAQEVQRDVAGGAVIQQDPALTGTSLVFVTGATFTGVSAGGGSTTLPTAPARAALTPVSVGDGTPIPSSSAQPAFPGSHGSDPPPPGSGC